MSGQKVTIKRRDGSTYQMDAGSFSSVYSGASMDGMKGVQVLMYDSNDKAKYVDITEAESKWRSKEYGYWKGQHSGTPNSTASKAKSMPTKWDKEKPTTATPVSKAQPQSSKPAPQSQPQANTSGTGANSREWMNTLDANNWQGSNGLNTGFQTKDLGVEYTKPGYSHKEATRKREEENLERWTGTAAKQMQKPGQKTPFEIMSEQQDKLNGYDASKVELDIESSNPVVAQKAKEEKRRHETAKSLADESRANVNGTTRNVETPKVIGTYDNDVYDPVTKQKVHSKGDNIYGTETSYEYTSPTTFGVDSKGNFGRMSSTYVTQRAEQEAKNMLGTPVGDIVSGIQASLDEKAKQFIEQNHYDVLLGNNGYGNLNTISRANAISSPEELRNALDNLPSSTWDNLLDGVVLNETKDGYSASIHNAAMRSGLSDQDYAARFVYPRLAQTIDEQIQKVLGERYKVRGATDYIIRKLTESAAGTIMQMSTFTREQRQLLAEATEKYNKSLSGWSGFFTKVAGASTTMIGDMPLMMLGGEAGNVALKIIGAGASKVLGSTVGKALTTTASNVASKAGLPTVAEYMTRYVPKLGTYLSPAVERIGGKAMAQRYENYLMANLSRPQWIGREILRGMISQPVNMGTFMGTKGLMNQISIGEDTSASALFGAMVDGFTEGAEMGLGMALLQPFSKMSSTYSTRAARIGSKFATKGAEIGLFAGMDYLSSVSEGRDFDLTDSLIDNAAMIVGMGLAGKMMHPVYKTKDRSGKDVTRFSFVDEVRDLWNGKDVSGIRLTPEERAIVTEKMGNDPLFEYSDMRNYDIEKYNKALQDGDTATLQELADARDKYVALLQNKDIPFETRNKISIALFGVGQGVVPLYDHFEIQEKTVITRSADGEAISVKEFKDADELRSIIEADKQNTKIAKIRGILAQMELKELPTNIDREELKGRIAEILPETSAETGVKAEDIADILLGRKNPGTLTVEEINALDSLRDKLKPIIDELNVNADPEVVAQNAQEEGRDLSQRVDLTQGARPDVVAQLEKDIADAKVALDEAYDKVWEIIRKNGFDGDVLPYTVYQFNEFVRSGILKTENEKAAFLDVMLKEQKYLSAFSKMNAFIDATAENIRQAADIEYFGQQFDGVIIEEDGSGLFRNDRITVTNSKTGETLYLKDGRLNADGTIESDSGMVLVADAEGNVRMISPEDLVFVSREAKEDVMNARIEQLGQEITAANGFSTGEVEAETPGVPGQNGAEAQPRTAGDSAAQLPNTVAEKERMAQEILDANSIEGDVRALTEEEARRIADTTAQPDETFRVLKEYIDARDGSVAEPNGTEAVETQPSTAENGVVTEYNGMSEFTTTTEKGRVVKTKSFVASDTTNKDGVRTITFGREIEDSKKGNRKKDNGGVITISKDDPIIDTVATGKLGVQGEISNEDATEYAKEIIEKMGYNPVTGAKRDRLHIKKITIAPDGRIFAELDDFGIDWTIILKRNPIDDIGGVGTPASEGVEADAMPMTESGKPDYGKASAGQIAKYVSENLGDKGKARVEATAKAAIDAETKAQKALDKAQDAVDNAPLTGDAAEKAEAKLEKAKADFETAKTEADKWRDVVAEMDRMAEEARNAESESNEPTTPEQPIDDNTGQPIPDITNDTPEDARKRGKVAVNGVVYERQQNTDGILGKICAVIFGTKSGDKKAGHMKLVEADQIQESHKGNSANPMHFIPEAQPKDRTSKDSVVAAQTNAKPENFDPALLTGDGVVYTESNPVVNKRGEVIQGNGRMMTLRNVYDNAETAQRYKDYLKQHAEEFGLKPEDIDSMEKPILVNEIDVDDKEAIRLGQMTNSDLESGGEERIKAKNFVQKAGEKLSTFINTLFKGADDETSLAQLIDSNGIEALKMANRLGIINNTQMVSAIRDGQLTAEAKNDIMNVLKERLFDGAPQVLRTQFENMPARVQRAILGTYLRDLQTVEDSQLLGDIRQSIQAFDDLMKMENFAKATKYEGAKKAINDWLSQQNMFGDVQNSEKYSNFALELAARMKTSKQKEMTDIFNEYYDLVQGKKEELDMFGMSDGNSEPLSKAEAIKKMFNIEIGENKNADKLQRGDDVAGNSDTGREGQRGSSGNAESGERDAQGAQGADGAGGAGRDGSEGKEDVVAEHAEAKRILDRFIENYEDDKDGLIDILKKKMNLDEIQAGRLVDRYLADRKVEKAEQEGYDAFMKDIKGFEPKHDAGWQQIYDELDRLMKDAKRDNDAEQMAYLEGQKRAVDELVEKWKKSKDAAMPVEAPIHKITDAEAEESGVTAGERHTVQKQLDRLANDVDKYHISTIEKWIKYLKTHRSYNKVGELQAKKKLAIYEAEHAKREKWAKENGVVSGNMTFDKVVELFEHFNDNPELAELAKKVFEVTKLFKPSIKMTKQLTTGAGGNSGLDGIVKFNYGLFGNPSIEGKKKAEIIIHELLHNATQSALQAYRTRNGRGKEIWEKMTDGQQKAVEEIFNIYEQIRRDRSHFKDVEGNGKGKAYGLTDEDEMVAELGTASFRDQCKAKGLWVAFKDAVKRFFGIMPEVEGAVQSNVYAQLREAVDYLLENPNIDVYNTYRGKGRGRSRMPAGERFDRELDSFREGTQKEFLHLGKPLGKLKACGVNCKELTLSPKVLNRHMKKYNFTTDDLKGLGEAIQNPILVYKHGKNSPNIVITTELEAKGGKLAISVELDKNGNVTAIDNVRSVHAKDAITEIDRLSKLEPDYLKENLRWVEKNKVSEWFNGVGLNRLMPDELKQKLNSVAKVINEHENPSVSEVDLTEDNSVKDFFIGEKGATPEQIDALELAEQMEVEGADANDIWRKTGWERGKDGKWRTEIPDMKIKGGEVKLTRGKKLGDVFEADELFEAHPELKDVTIKRMTLTELMETDADAMYDHDEGVIKVLLGDDKVLGEAQLPTILHEVQHAIQYEEGFATGSSENQVRWNAGKIGKQLKEQVDTLHSQIMEKEKAERERIADERGYSKYQRKSHASELSNEAVKNLRENDADYGMLMDKFSDVYKRYAALMHETGHPFFTRDKFRDPMKMFEIYKAHAGEVEARNVSRRHGLTDEQRQQFAPSSTEDFERDEQILVDGGGLSFHKLEPKSAELGEDDRKAVEELQSGKTKTVYRAMQVIDGKLYPPMAARIGGEMVEGAKPGDILKADEHPEMIKMVNGKPQFVLDKGGKDATGKKATSVPARYNPYWHTSNSMLNDQFKSAWIRPNMVVVECEIPEMELTSGYKAEYAKDAVGMVPWKSGSVTGELVKQGHPGREVYLSRYCKIGRIVPEAEAAEHIKEFMGGRDVEIPVNTVTPKLRAELEKQGVKIGAPEKGVKMSEQIQEALERGLEVDNSLSADKNMLNDGRYLYSQNENGNFAKDYYVDVDDKQEYGVVSSDLFSRYKNESKYGVVSRSANHFYFVDYFGDKSFKTRAVFDIDADRELINAFEKEIYGKTFRTSDDLDRVLEELVDREGKHLGNNGGLENRGAAVGDGVLASRQLEEGADTIGSDGEGVKDSEDYVTAKSAYDGSRKPRIIFVEKGREAYREGSEVRPLSRERIDASAVQKTMDSLGGGSVVGSEADLDADGRRALAENPNAKGWYDKKTGEVTVYLPNNSSAHDAERTIFHEKVGHEGLRGLLGENFNQFLHKVWMGADKALRSEIVKAASAKGWDFNTAIDEHLAKMAEDFSEKGWKAVRIVKDAVNWALAKAGFRTQMTVNDVRRALWLSKNKLEGKTGSLEYRIKKAAFEAKMKRDVMKEDMDENLRTFSDAKDGRIEYDEKSGQFLFAGGVGTPSGHSAKAIYERALNKVGFLWTEAHQNALRSVQIMQDAIMGKGKVKDSENTFLALNRLGSQDMTEMETFDREHAKPLTELMSKILPQFEGATAEERYDNLEKYVYAMHGLERNRVFGVRDMLRELANDPNSGVDTVQLQSEFDAKRADLKSKLDNDPNYTMKDYYDELDEWIRDNVDDTFEASKMDKSGLSDVEKYDWAIANGEYDEDAVMNFIMDSQTKMGDAHKDLHSKIKAITDATLKKQYDGGLIAKEQYEKAKGMFDWYVPLRGFDAETAEDIYSYIGRDYNPMSVVGLRKAEQRQSAADHPLATMMIMANGTIMQANRNTAKMNLLRLATNNENDLVKELNVYYEKLHDTQGNEYLSPIYPKLREGMTGAQMDAAMKAYEAEIEAIKADPNREIVKDRSKHGNLQLRFEYESDAEQHMIHVRTGGKDRVLFLNGNPRAAQAINGQVRDKNMPVLKSVNNWLSQMATSRSLTFIGRNKARDFEYATASIEAQEGHRYAAAFVKNYARFEHTGMNKHSMMSLFKRYHDGTLDMSDKVDRLFKEFVDNGGRTGYVQMSSIDEKQNELVRLVKKNSLLKNRNGRVMEIAGKSVGKIADAWFGTIETINEAVENQTRFATYYTSRTQAHRTVARSIYDAKNSGVNFNLTGAGLGTMSMKPHNESLFHKYNRLAASLSATFMRNSTIFYNAGVQGMSRTWQVTKEGGAWQTTKAIGMMAAAPFALGMMMPMLNSIIANSIDDDDDKKKFGGNPYAMLPEYERRQNLCLYIGHGRFAKLPLAIELRAFYGIGDLAAGATNRFGGVYDQAKGLDGVELTAPESGKAVFERYSYDVMKELAQITPVDAFGGTKALTNDFKGGVAGLLIPSALAPFFAAGFAGIGGVHGSNVSWTGAPVSKRGSWNETNPEWTKAASKTGKGYVTLAKWLSDKTGGNLSEGGWININPSELEYLTGQLTSSGGKDVIELASTLADISKVAYGGVTGKEVDADVDMGRAPITKAFYRSKTADNSLANTRTRYYNYRSEAEKTKQRLSSYKKNAKVSVEDKIGYEALQNSPVAARSKVMSKFIGKVKDLQHEKNEAKTRAERETIQEQINAEMQRAVDLMDLIERNRKRGKEGSRLLDRDAELAR